MPTRDHCHIDVVHGTCWAIPSARIQDEVRGRIGAVRRQRAPQSRNVGGVSLVFRQPVVKHCSSQRARAGRDDRSLAPVTWVTAWGLATPTTIEEEGLLQRTATAVPCQVTCTRAPVEVCAWTSRGMNLLDHSHCWWQWSETVRQAGGLGGHFAMNSITSSVLFPGDDLFREVWRCCRWE